MDEFFAINRLSAYIDGELSDAEMAEVARAIEEQPEVREAYEELLAAVELVREHGLVQAPATFHRDVMQRVEGLSAGRSWLERLLGPLGRNPVQGLGVAVVVAAVLLLVFRGPVLDGVERLGGDHPEKAEPEREAAVPTAEPEDPAQGRADDNVLEDATPAPEPTEQPTLDEQGDAKGELAGLIGTRGTSEKPASTKGGSSKTSSGGVPIQELLKKEEGTYIPDWDKEASAPTATLQTPEPEPKEPGPGSLAVSPFAYRLTPSEPDALRKLVALAEKLGGGLYSPSGEPMEPYSLTVERNYAQVVLHIPASRLESVEPYLRNIGGVVQVRAEQDRLYAADSVHVTVEVQYQP